MKCILNFSIFLFSYSITYSQVPNGNFEDWQTIDSIENPAQWQTNNYYVGFMPVEKTTDAIEGDFSMKISSTARDIFGGATMPGCAHVKLFPAENYKYMTASVKIDSIEEGEIAIRVKQRTQDGLFEKIGGWKRTELTSGVLQIGFPLEQISMDTLLIEVWAFNKETVLGNEGYSEAIIDNLQLTTTVSTEENIKNEDSLWTIYPNPTNGILNVRLNHDPTIRLSELKIKDIRGEVLKVVNQPFSIGLEEKLSLQGFLPGIYILELSTGNEIIKQEKFIVF